MIVEEEIHSHPDHIVGALEIQELAHCKVYAGARVFVDSGKSKKTLEKIRRMQGISGI